MICLEKQIFNTYSHCGHWDLPAGTTRQALNSRQQRRAGPRVWNTLLEETISAPSLTIFCQRLKIWLFRQSYPELII